MGKSVHDDVLDQALNYIKNNCTRICACSAEPTTYAEATSTYELADVTVASGDFTVANGSVSGRKVTVAQKSGIAVDVGGDITHLGYVDVSNTKLLAVTTTTTKTVTTADTITIPATILEIRDPT